jgi:spore coat protein U-like protein
VANASTPLDSTGTISIACTKGATGVSIGLDYGTNSGGQKNRYLNIEKTFQYELYKPIHNGRACAHNAIWGNTVNADTYDVNPPTNKRVRDFLVCARIPAGQDVSAGAYSDNVLAVVNF